MMLDDYTISSIDAPTMSGVILRHEDLLYGEAGLDAEKLEAWLGHPAYQDAMIVDGHGRLAAYAFMRMATYKGEQVIRILRICVLPTHQHMGYGKVIHEAIVSFGFRYYIRCPERWVASQLWLQRRGWNPRVVKSGYVWFGITPIEEAEGEDVGVVS